MNESSFSMTLQFHQSVDYRRLISHIRRIPSLHAPFLGVLQGQARIYVRRSLAKRKLTFISNSSTSDVLFDLHQHINPQTMIIHDFSTRNSSDPFNIEFDRSLHACINAGVSCFDNPDDPETFHCLRLDIRAFRSFLKISKKLNVAGLDELRSITRKIAKATNSLRDADVQIALYEKFREPLPAALLQARIRLLKDAMKMLLDSVFEMGFIALRISATGKTIDHFDQKVLHYLSVQTNKATKRWRIIDLLDDLAIHSLRIKMKLLSYGYNQRKENDEHIMETAKSIKAIQSRLGDVRDLRAFYRLPGLDPETRFRAVQKLSSLERELEKMEIMR